MRLVQMDEGAGRQVGGPVDRSIPFQPLRRGDRDDLLLRQRCRRVVGPQGRVAAAHAERKTLRDDVEVAIGGVQAQVDARQRRAGAGEPRGHP
jgi:hypothetical protein